MKRLGTNKVLVSSYIWLFLIPLGVRLLSKEHEDLFHHLPFTWQIWFYTACAFSAALLIYSTSCPPLVRNHDRFDEFRAEGRGSAQLLRALSETLKKTFSPHDEMITSNFVTLFTLRTSHSELLLTSETENQTASRKQSMAGTPGPPHLRREV